MSSKGHCWVSPLELDEVALGKASCSPLQECVIRVVFGTLLSIGELQTLRIWITAEEETAITFTYIHQHSETCYQTRSMNRFWPTWRFNLQAGWKAQPHWPTMPRDSDCLRSRLAPALSISSSEKDRCQTLISLPCSWFWTEKWSVS